MPAGGKIGNKGGGRKKQSVEMEFFRLLDEAMPKAVRYCVRLINEAEKNKCKSLLLPSSYDNLAIQATKVLMSRAPERIKHSGDEDNPIRLVVDN